MAFTLETAISELRAAAPFFPIDNNSEKEGWAYLIFSDFARFICSEAEVLQYVRSDDEARLLSKVPICMQFLERALEEADPNGRDLILDCLQTLAVCERNPEIKAWAGPDCLASWH